MSRTARLAGTIRKEEILSAAQRLFSQRGYHATSVRDIARQVDLQGGSLYAHIGGKEDILWDLVNRVADEFFSALQPIAEADLPPAEKFRQAVIAHLGVITRNLEAATVYLQEWRSLAAPRRALLRDRRDAYEALWRALIAEGVHHGVFHPQDEKFTGLLVLSALNNVPTWYKPKGGLSPEAIAERFSDILLQGLQARKDGG